MSNVSESTHGKEDSAGAVLHAERRRQNMSVGDVSRHLKLSVRQVEALEHDEFDIFGGSVFVHGFLRNYAKLLGIDVAPLIEAADRKLAGDEAPGAGERLQHAHAAASVPGESAQKSLIPLFLVAAIVIAGVVGWMLAREKDTASDDGPASVIAEDSPGEPEESNSAALLTEPGAEVTPQTPEAAAVREESQRVAGVPERMVVLVFRQESWVEVTDRYGEVIFSELAPPGTSRRVSGQPPIGVVIGNAAGVDLIYNNEPIDLEPHTRVDVARLTLE